MALLTTITIVIAGPSYDKDICPQHVPLGRFENNVVHSVGWYGLWVFEKYFPKVGGCCRCTEPEPAIFKTLTTWNSLRGGAELCSKILLTYMQPLFSRFT